MGIFDWLFGGPKNKNYKRSLGNNYLFPRVQKHFLNRRVDVSHCKKVQELNYLGYFNGR